MAERRNYEESCRILQEHGFIEDGNIPPMPTQMPSFDDEEPLGVSFFRTGVWDDDLSNLTLPRTFFGRSEVSHISFANADLSEARICWCDIAHVDFSNANLNGSDLRRSKFQNVSFVSANLSNADMRQAEFINCDFTETIMLGAKLTERQAKMLKLAPKQYDAIDLQTTDGEAPGGG